MTKERFIQLHVPTVRSDMLADLDRLLAATMEAALQSVVWGGTAALSDAHTNRDREII